jgi:hypothetical protein
MRSVASLLDTQAASRLFVAQWRKFDVRAGVVLPFLISIRRSPDHWHKLSEILAVAAQAATISVT